jgi:glutamate-ammonia-ligase adenylyltransferase
MAAAAEAAFGQPWRPEFAAEIVATREKMESGRGKRDVKRGAGGQVDIEFIVQMLQLKHGADHPEVRTPNTWSGLEALHASGLLTAADFDELHSAYDFLRSVESRLRITTNRALDEIPNAPAERDKLARRLGFDCGPTFIAELDGQMERTRKIFRRLTDAER